MEILIEEENLHFFCALGEEVDLEFGISARGAIERAAGQVGAKVSEQAHHFDGGAAHLEQAFGLLFVLVQGLPGAQFGLDFGVVGQGVGNRRAQLPGRLALGEAKVADAVFGHHACSQGSDFAPQRAVVGSV